MFAKVTPLWLCFAVIQAFGQPCSNASYHGTYYGLYALQQGTVSGFASWPELDKVVADGAGGLTVNSTTAGPSSITRSTQTYTYNVKADCSGTQTPSGSAQPSAAFQLIGNGRAKLLGTSASGTVLSGESYRSAAHCGNASLSGTYGLLITFGTVGAAPPFTEVGPVVFDGTGGFTFTESENGITYNGTGTYSVISDCSGTMTMSFNGGTTYNLVIALIEGGKVLVLDVDSHDQYSGFLEPVSNRSVLGQFAFGGGWYSALYFTNNNGFPVTFQVSFFKDDSSPLSVPGMGSSTTVNLAAQATGIVEAANSGPLNQGYVSLALPPGVQAYGLFRQSVPGIPDQEAVVPLASASATQATLTFDESSYITGVAIVNPSPIATAVTVSVTDDTGAQIGASSVNVPANGKIEAALRNLPGLSGVAGARGKAVFSVTSGNVAVLGLRFNGSAFSSIPSVAN